MKKMMNLTTTYFDLPRYADNADLKQAYRQFGLDGLELMEGGEDHDHIVMPEDVVGAHLKYFSHWLSIWHGDADIALAEYDDWETVASVYGGIDRTAIIEKHKNNLQFVSQYQPEYAVMHAADVTIQASITQNYLYSDTEVVDATVDLANQVFNNDEHNFALLFENLSCPGMTLLNPDMVKRLLDGVEYKNAGVMLDIGHLIQTNTSIRTTDQAIDYIYSVLSQYDNLDFIKGIHLHQSLSGEYMQGVLANPYEITGSYAERIHEVMNHVLTLDTHKPFVSDRITELVSHINPDYLVYEFISSTREEHETYLKQQADCFG